MFGRNEFSGQCHHIFPTCTPCKLLSVLNPMISRVFCSCATAVDHYYYAPVLRIWLTTAESNECRTQRLSLLCTRKWQNALHLTVGDNISIILFICILHCACGTFFHLHRCSALRYSVVFVYRLCPRFLHVEFSGNINKSNFHWEPILRPASVFFPCLLLLACYYCCSCVSAGKFHQ